MGTSKVESTIFLDVSLALFPFSTRLNTQWRIVRHCGGSLRLQYFVVVRLVLFRESTMSIGVVRGTGGAVDVGFFRNFFLVLIFFNVF